MSNRLFQSVIHQMKDAVDRVIGVVDENGVIIACSELVKIGEIRQGVRDELTYSNDLVVSGGYTYRAIGPAGKAEYIVFEHGPFNYEQENRSVEDKIERAMAEFDFSGTGYCLDTSPGRIMYFYFNPEQYFKYIRPVRKA